MTPLLRHRLDDLVAFGAEGERTAGDLAADAAKVAAALPACRPGSHVLLVFESDRHAFAAALLGTWSAGHAVMLPPDGSPRTIMALLGRSDVACLLHDTGAGGHLQVQSILDGPPQAVAAPGPAPRALVTTFTASSDEPMTKTAEALLGEVERLAQTLRIPEGSRFVVDVVPTHLQGLVLGVLLPLCTGSAFSRAIAPSPDVVDQLLASADTCVSMPHRLRAAWASVSRPQPSLRRILCCTPRPPDPTARTLARAQAVRVLELYATDETGFVAWRSPAEHEAWHPVEGVRATVEPGGRLLVDAVSAASVGSGAIATGDRAEPIPGGGFALLGREQEHVRSDAGELSLPALRSWLLERPEVCDADVIAIDPNDAGPTILAAVVGPRCDAEDLREAMRQRFGLASLRIAVLDRIERDPSGTPRAATFLRAFGLSEGGHPLSTRLESEALRIDDENATRVVTTRVRIPGDYVHFEGHFDGHPILAAVVQLHELLLPLVRRARPELGDLQALQKLKFLGRISPGDEVTVTLRFDADAPACDFEIACGTQRCSAGRLRFAAREVA